MQGATGGGAYVDWPALTKERRAGGERVTEQMVCGLLTGPSGGGGRNRYNVEIGQ